MQLLKRVSECAEAWGIAPVKQFPTKTEEKENTDNDQNKERERKKQSNLYLHKRISRVVQGIGPFRACKAHLSTVPNYVRCG